MAKHYEIRAHYDKDSIVVYQAYAKAIAEPALKAQTFVAPFSLNRMTWIKPSFLWLMHRSNWGRKANQETILAVHIRRSGWEEALRLGVLTSYEPAAHRNINEWREAFEKASVHVQWDTERSLKGVDLQIDSIQVGLSRHVIRQFVEQWIVKIEDYTPLCRKIYELLQRGDSKNAAKLLPPEKPYPLSPELGKHLLISS